MTDKLHRSDSASGADVPGVSDSRAGQVLHPEQTVAQWRQSAAGLAIDAIAAGVAHEINNPIGFIRFHPPIDRRPRPPT